MTTPIVFCNPSNIEESLLYINKSLFSKGVIQAEKLRLSHDIRDNCNIVNIIYRLLRATDEERLEKESLLDAIKNNEYEKQRDNNTIKRLKNELELYQNECQLQLNKVRTLERDQAELITQNKGLKDVNAKNELTLKALKNQLSVSLRQHEQQMETLKGNYGLVKARKGRNLNSMLIVKEPIKQNTNAPILPETASFLQQNDENSNFLNSRVNNDEFQLLKGLNNELKKSNGTLLTCLSGTLNSLVEMLSPLYERPNSNPFEVCELNAILLDAKIQNQLLFIRNLLHERKYVSIDELDAILEENEKNKHLINILQKENKRVFEFLTNMHDKF
ncbi:Mitotic-spindle disanchored Msd1 [Schizosaccharomyces pombe]|uniref:Meiotically up-regulated gene 172 protein n=1 Tax=Schizosaccharomyces pombe (strain 972 / ATCC 24843) TaxID=284812 RepID=MU172_SCHPO|nr:mitotic-spindle disanchored Msd1 [Schizosaccharomyces pombe]Q9P6R4.1 RecName: Full=Meiotically up-regulated gene 172 protein [Schizosaccharomyces pombe 972h-]CAB89881.1 mitotic-spindle disanchored Msd1 [Schizosaccharomyces pombe]|eukprot:NP_596261.1 mitotic-spindle disanchored Msd1 [Schizosaccharomyces pombe]